jgi:energy-coupling factor transporter ATP-binding protein EcfA2
MRIRRILLNDFRAFPGPVDYEFDLDGKNLLLFGENGSGKSSLFLALREFFQPGLQGRPFKDFRHAFTKDAAGNDLATGKVAIEFDDGSGVHAWDIVQDVRPRQVAQVSEASLRFGAVDYRETLRTNIFHEQGYPNLYKPLVEGILRRLPVIADGRQTTLGALSDNMLSSRPRWGKNHTWRVMEKLDAARTAFNEALANHLPAVVTEANRCLAGFGDLGMTFQLISKNVTYSSRPRKFEDQQIDLVCQLYGHDPKEPQYFLNEARLSALALALYFGAIRASIPPNLPGTEPARVLVLDDVLMGMDLPNRLPVLRLLDQEFADWQIVLLTHDRAWFDLAREFTEHSKRWLYLRLLEMPTVPGQPSRPQIDPHKDLLDVGDKHLAAGDLMAAAVYARAAFETHIKNVCENFGVEVQFKKSSKDFTANKLWDGIIKRQQWRQDNGKIDFIDPHLMRDVETMRSTILNQLSHSGSPSLEQKTCNLRSIQSVALSNTSSLKLKRFSLA